MVFRGTKLGNAEILELAEQKFQNKSKAFRIGSFTAGDAVDASAFQRHSSMQLRGAEFDISVNRGR